MKKVLPFLFLLFLVFSKINAYYIDSSTINESLTCQNSYFTKKQKYLDTSLIYSLSSEKKYLLEKKKIKNNLQKLYNNCKNKILYVMGASNVYLDIVAPNTSKTLRELFNKFLTEEEKFLNQKIKNNNSIDSSKNEYNSSPNSSSINISYTAKIGERDKYNSNGNKIYKPEYIIQQERANYHKFKIRDSKDEYDSFFIKKENRLKIYKMIQNAGGLSKKVKYEILNHNPLIKVTVRNNKLYVQIIK